jgi:hypothetical protein
MAKILTRKGLEITSSPLEALDAGNQKIVNAADPTNAQDVATKAYVDTAASSASEALDGTFRIKNTTDETKQLAFDVSGVTTATTRTIIMPDADVDLGLVATAIQSSEKGAVNGVATLNASGKLTASQIPAIAITETFVVADITARDALVIGSADGEVQTGDVAIVTDASADVDVDSGAASYIYDGSAWQLLKTPDSPVQSVNGQTGVVVLDTDDVAEGAANFYYTQARFDSAFALKSTTDLSEGSNLYFTEARVLATALTGYSVGADADLAATDTVLEAFQKLQGQHDARESEISANTTAISDHLTDTVDAHDASAISVVASGNLAATEVQAALDEHQGDIDQLNIDVAAAQGDIDSHIAQATGAHAASAISVTPTGNLAADDVQEALAELQGDIDTLNTDVSALELDSGRSFEAGVAGEAMAANQIWLVRRAKSGETAGRYYKAQADSAINSRVVGFIVVGATALSAGDPVRIYKLGSGELGSSDTPFTAPADLNALVYLSQTTAGKWTLAPTSAAGDWIKEVGFVADASILEFQAGLLVQA